MKKIEKDLVTLAAIAIGLIAIVSSAYFFSFSGALSKDQAIWGQFGDYIGGLLNPALAFLALILLLKTVQIQSNTLDLSLEELALTRKELEKSSNSLAIQADVMKVQNFERSFFRLIELHHSIIGSLFISKSEDQVFAGRSLLTREVNELKRIWNLNITKYGKNNDSDTMLESAQIFFDSNLYIFDHYFSNLKKILEFINEQAPLDKEKYVQIYEAQLSNHELALLTYYVYTDMDTDFSRIVKESFNFPFTSVKLVDGAHVRWLSW